MATQEQPLFGSNYGYFDISVVGYFPVDPTLPPFEPQLSKFVKTDAFESEPIANFAWVSHDGNGKVDGFPICESWEEESKNPFLYLSFLDDYLLPEDSDCHIPVLAPFAL